VGPSPMIRNKASGTLYIFVLHLSTEPNGYVWQRYAMERVVGE
jgi:hypothetical protein